MPFAPRLLVPSFLLFALSLVSRSATAQTPATSPELVQRYAIVIGSNKAGGQPLDDLHFADDDALNNCELLAELGMAVTVFTTRDRATRARRQRKPHAFAEQCSYPREPFTQSVEEQLKSLVQEVRSAPKGTRNIILLWFSGHGNGSSLFLQNGPLTTGRLRQLLLEPTQGYAEVHLILDSCHARKFVVGRGDRSQKLDPAMEKQVRAYPKGLNLSVNSHVGALIATTEFNKVHEYSPLEAGILSYELRAAFRNAADATGDWRVTYREAEAFVWAANAAVESVDARMYGQAFLPGGEDKVLVDWSDTTARGLPHVSMTVSAAEQVRFRILDSRGVPVLETHKGREDDPTRTTNVFLPANQQYDIDILGSEGQRLDRRTLAALPPGQVTFAALPRGAIGKAARSGEIEGSLEKGLFQRPYDARLFDDYRRFRQDSPEAAWLASRDVPEIDVDEGGGVGPWPYVFGGVGAAALGTGVAFNLLAHDENDKAEDLCNGSTSGVCTVGSVAERRMLQDHIDTAKRHRAVSYVSFGVAGAALVGGAVIFVTQRMNQPDQRAWVAPSFGSASAGLLFGGRF
jgi:hypothetical protein